MEEFVLLIFSFPGAVIRYAFFRCFGSEKEFKEYLKDHYVLNGMVAGIFFFALFMAGKIIFKF